jgi:hypothetical protein
MKLHFGRKSFGHFFILLLQIQFHEKLQIFLKHQLTHFLAIVALKCKKYNIYHVIFTFTFYP